MDFAHPVKTWRDCQPVHSNKSCLFPCLNPVNVEFFCTTCIEDGFVKVIYQLFQNWSQGWYFYKVQAHLNIGENHSSCKKHTRSRSLTILNHAALLCLQFIWGNFSQSLFASCWSNESDGLKTAAVLSYSFLSWLWFFFISHNVQQGSLKVKRNLNPLWFKMSQTFFFFFTFTRNHFISHTLLLFFVFAALKHFCAFFVSSPTFFSSLFFACSLYKCLQPSAHLIGYTCLCCCKRFEKIFFLLPALIHAVQLLLCRWRQNARQSAGQCQV